ncbi:MAG: putative oxidoreductase, partial [Candidatus Binatota bacterium]|nr:putative oxidoreductase [Candidatus Binatota bacterium]
IQSGLEAARHPGPQAELAGPLIQKASGPLKLPADPLQVVRGAGAVTAVAGLLLAAGKLPRLSALAIVVTAPAIQNNQPFWKEKDPELRRSQRNTFITNLGLLGGALLAAVDTEGRPGLAWRSRRAGKLAAEVARDAGTGAVLTVKDAQESARKSARQARKAAKKAQKRAVRQADKQATKASRAASKAAGKARASLPV